MRHITPLTVLEVGVPVLPHGIAVDDAEQRTLQRQHVRVELPLMRPNHNSAYSRGQRSNELW